jgi:hypothetical protein
MNHLRPSWKFQGFDVPFYLPGAADNVSIEIPSFGEEMISFLQTIGSLQVLRWNLPQANE